MGATCVRSRGGEGRERERKKKGCVVFGLMCALHVLWGRAGERHVPRALFLLQIAPYHAVSPLYHGDAHQRSSSDGVIPTSCVHSTLHLTIGECADVFVWVGAPFVNAGRMSERGRGMSTGRSMASTSEPRAPQRTHPHLHKGFCRTKTKACGVGSNLLPDQPKVLATPVSIPQLL
jgi:hypothetical protein